MNRPYTFRQCVEYASKHNIKFVIHNYSTSHDNYLVTMCDAIDGYLRSENYYVWLDRDTNIRYIGYCCHDTFELAKNAELFNRILKAFNTNYCGIEFGAWFGRGECNVINV